jgi:hypothetical protein
MTSPVSLATASAGVFRSLLGASFGITLPTGEKITATLSDVSEGVAAHPERRAPFSLIFRAPRDPGAPRPTQGLLKIEHEANGTLEVFAVPLQPKGDIAEWQVVFG